MKTKTPDFVSEAAGAALEDVIALPEGTLPCRVCGVACTREQAAAVAEPIVENRYGFDGRLIAQNTQAAVLCAVCAAVKAQARALIVKHAVFEVQVWRVADMLHALDMLGGPEIAFTDDLDVIALLDQPLGLGNPAPFGGASAAVAFASSAKIGTCSARRFAHVDEQKRRRLREAVARWMKQRLEVPEPIAPPASSERRGCLMCGVGSVLAYPSRSAKVWSEAYVAASALGAGNGAAGAIDGHTCPACTAAIDKTEGGGVAALQTAVLHFIGYQRRSVTPPTLIGIRGWGLADGARPNTTPWQHVDLHGLHRSLASFEGEA